MADGLLDSIDQAIRQQYQTTKQGLGLLVSDPRRYLEERNKQLEAFNQAQMAAMPAERAELRGLLATPEQLAAKQYADQQLQDLALGFAGTTKPLNNVNYMITHRPMTVEGGAARLHEASKSFGDDIYGNNALKYFGSGLTGEQTSLNILKNIRGKPDAEITIYRGVPKGVKSINEGDWVTLDPKMAAEYGNVVSKKVKVKDITTWPDSLVEFGYYPSK